MTTQNGAPADPQVNPSPQVPAGDVTAFMQGPMPMPIPSEAERRGALAVAAPEIVAPLETPVQQPHIEQPTPIQPGIVQPPPIQPAPVAPQPTQPTPADWQQQLDTLNNRIQEQQTVFETQRADTEAREQQTQVQEVTNAAKQYGMQQYQKYIAGGTTDETAQQWARSDAQLVYQAYGANIQSQLANTQTQAIAKQYGISSTDIPTGLPQQAMQQFASMRSELNRLNGQTQAVTKNQLTAQTFDSSLGNAPVNAMESLLARLGDHTKAVSPQDTAAWYQMMNNQGLKR